VTVTGRVVSASAAPVAGALVESGAAKSVADAAGQFSVVVQAGRVRLSVSATGYDTQHIDVTAAPNMAPITVTLVPAAFRDEVAVEGRARPDPAAPANVVLAPQEVRSVAGGGENVFKVLQTLPGVNATNDFDSRLSVRGGGPDQNLTVMDGVEIHNPYRLFGFTSAFNPETIARFDLTAGGFSPKYGDRLSSLLVVDNRDGTRLEALRGSVSAALTDANIVFEGRLPARSNGSWLVTGRRTYYDLVADRITDTHLPSFADLQTRVAWDLRAGQRLTFLALRSREHTDASFSDADNRLDLKNGASNDLASLSLLSTFGSRTVARTIVSWYRNGDLLNIDGLLENESLRANAPGDQAFGLTSLVVTRNLVVRDVSLRHEFEHQMSPRQLWQAGAEAHALRTTWGFTIGGGRNLNEANGTSLQGGIALPSLLDSSRANTRMGLWLIDRLTLSSRVRVAPGVRLDRSSLGGEVVISPRVSAEVGLGGGWLFRGSLGRFTQTPGYEKLLQADYFVDLSPEVTAGLKSEKSTHTIAAVERRWNGFALRVEGYFKHYDGLIAGRLETEEERAARVAQYAFPSELQFSVPASPQITSAPGNISGGRAYGMDVYVERKATSARSRLSGWASYTWGHADVDNYGRRYPFDYDRRHALSTVFMSRLSGRLEVGGTLRVASGFPYTSVAGVRVAAVRPDGQVEGAPGSLVPLRDPSGNLIWTTDFGGVANLNNARLPVYARFDFRATFHSRSANGRWLIYVDITNLFDRTNAADLTPTLRYDPTSDRPRVDYDAAGGFGRLPSVGVRIRF